MPISAKYHKWTNQDLHHKWKEIRTRWKQNTESSTSKQDPPHLKHSNNGYVPLTIDSPYIKGGKNNKKQYQQKQRLYKQKVKTFWWTTGEPNYHHGRTNQEDVEKFWKPKEYLITCLPVMYKILSSIVTSWMSHHIESNKIISNEQKGNASNIYGTIDQLIII